MPYDDHKDTTYMRNRMTDKSLLQPFLRSKLLVKNSTQYKLNGSFQSPKVRFSVSFIVVFVVLIHTAFQVGRSP